MIHRIEPDPETGWFVVTDPTDTGLKAGAVVWVKDRDAEAVHYTHGRAGWNAQVEFFETHFRYAPNGAELRQQEIAALMKDIERIHEQASNRTKALGSGAMHIEEDGAVSSTALVKSGTAEQAKMAVAEVRNQAKRFKTSMEIKQNELRALIEEQQGVMLAKLKDLEQFVQKAEKAIWTINLYLGTKEEIAVLQDGEPAPADETIVIRQKVLYMDEECAVAAEEGGLDARHIDRFDDWLLENPDHLDQVLPERKGIVALQPRKKKRDYGDPWTNAQMAAANKKTYFLIRNGERLFRFWTSYEASERLMPREDEFLQYFEERIYDYKTGGYRTERIKPGSKSWMEAQQKATDAQFPFRVFFLMLQGLFDRTTVFHPLPGPVRLDNPATWGTIFRIVKDDDKTLPDGYERFKNWLTRINKQLTVGCRVTGAFSHWQEGLRNYDQDYGNSRLIPPRTEYPKNGELYTLEGKRDDGFYFRYKRTNENWRNWGEEFKNRATCVVYPTDRFLLNFDAPECTVDRMQYYLRSRLDREEYAYMFPVLKAAIAAKKAEAEEEAPFRLLLAGEIARVHGIPIDEAEGVVPDLVDWWKLKNRYHRALTSDDAKALRMIVAEFGRRQNASSDAEDARVLLFLQQLDPKSPVLVACKGKDAYVALYPENDEDVFVREVHLSTKNEVTVTDERPWRTADARWRSWRVIHESPRWSRWDVSASRWEHLTDHERLELSDEMRGLAEEAGYLVLAATFYRKNNTVYLFHRPKPPEIPERGRVEDLVIGVVAAKWKRDQRRNVVLESQHGIKHGYTHAQYRGTGSPFDNQQQKNQPPWAWKGEKVLWTDPIAIDIVDREYEAVKEAQSRHHDFESRVSNLTQAMRRILQQRDEADAYAKFLADYNDPELWEGHKKTLKCQSVFDGLQRLIRHLLANEVDPRGMTLREAKERFDQLPGEERPHYYQWNDYRREDPTPPDSIADVVIPQIEGI